MCVYVCVPTVTCVPEIIAISITISRTAHRLIDDSRVMTAYPIVMPTNEHMRSPLRPRRNERREFANSGVLRSITKRGISVISVLTEQIYDESATVGEETSMSDVCTK
jgi:hypothetical protein